MDSTNASVSLSRNFKEETNINISFATNSRFCILQMSKPFQWYKFCSFATNILTDVKKTLIVNDFTIFWQMLKEITHSPQCNLYYKSLVQFCPHFAPRPSTDPRPRKSSGNLIFSFFVTRTIIFHIISDDRWAIETIWKF